MVPKHAKMKSRLLMESAAVVSDEFNALDRSGLLGGSVNTVNLAKHHRFKFQTGNREDENQHLLYPSSTLLLCCSQLMPPLHQEHFHHIIRDP